MTDIWTPSRASAKVKASRAKAEAEARARARARATRDHLVCNRCKGTGLPGRVCATQAGSTSTTKCGNCGGNGQWVDVCTSFGGGT